MSNFDRLVVEVTKADRRGFTAALDAIAREAKKFKWAEIFVDYQGVTTEWSWGSRWDKMPKVVVSKRDKNSPSDELGIIIPPQRLDGNCLAFGLSSDRGRSFPVSRVSSMMKEWNAAWHDGF